MRGGEGVGSVRAPARAACRAGAAAFPRRAYASPMASGMCQIGPARHATKNYCEIHFSHAFSNTGRAGFSSVSTSMNDDWPESERVGLGASPPRLRAVELATTVCCACTDALWTLIVVGISWFTGGPHRRLFLGGAGLAASDGGSGVLESADTSDDGAFAAGISVKARSPTFASSATARPLLTDFTSAAARLWPKHDM